MLDALLSSQSMLPDQLLYPLHFACADGDLGLVKKLVESRRQEVNQCFGDLYNGSCPLHWAVCSGSSHIVQYLLSKHADVNLLNKNGSSALHLACQGGSAEMISKLVQAGAKTSVRDQSNKLPLDLWIKHAESSGRSAEAAWKALPALLADDSAGRQFGGEKLKQSISETLDQLQEEAARLVELQETLELSPSLAPPVRDKTKIYFQVGERVFSSTRHVLMRFRSPKLASLVEQAETQGSERSERSARLSPRELPLHGVFPERDGELFDRILSFLETGRAPPATSERECREVMREAGYFELPALVLECEKMLEQWHFRKATPSSFAQAVEEAKDGETIVLAAGEYKVNLVLRKSITLRGETRLRYSPPLSLPLLSYSLSSLPLSRSLSLVFPTACSLPFILPHLSYSLSSRSRPPLLTPSVSSVSSQPILPCSSILTLVLESDHADCMLGSKSLHGAFHGDLQHKFCVFPAEVQEEGKQEGNGLQRKMRGRAEEVCSNSEFVGTRKDGGREFVCRGHVVVAPSQPERPAMVVEEGSVLLSDLLLLPADEASTAPLVSVQGRGLLLMEKCMVESKVQSSPSILPPHTTATPSSAPSPALLLVLVSCKCDGWEQGDFALEIGSSGRANVKDVRRRRRRDAADSLFLLLPSSSLPSVAVSLLLRSLLPGEPHA
eukprot:712953-Hanusia_phi.AAC.1